MIAIDSLVSFASWEDRFILGMEITLNKYKIKNMCVFFYNEFASWTEDNRNKLKVICKQRKVKLSFREISSEKPSDGWKLYDEEFNNRRWNSKNVLVDISTMPRESIWTIFYFLQNAGASVKYSYYKPERYNDDWLSQEPEKPRLLFKHSGIAKLGKPTALLVITGFDPDRTLQLFSFFEPKQTFLGIQSGSQFDSNKKNLEAHKIALKGQHNITHFKIDAYSQDHGQKSIEKIIIKSKDEFNLILSSLGPKPSAVALYKAQKNYPDVALVYAPSKKFNKEYSYGIIEEAVIGEL